jgi:hypothetical protein
LSAEKIARKETCTTKYLKLDSLPESLRKGNLSYDIIIKHYISIRCKSNKTVYISNILKRRFKKKHEALLIDIYIA